MNRVRQQNGNKRAVAYIAGRYRASTPARIHENIEHARKYAIKYWQIGYAVICPHMNSAFLDGVVPDFEFMDGCLEMVRRADVIVMIPGWKESEGACMEQALAEKLKKVIIYEPTEQVEGTKNSVWFAQSQPEPDYTVGRDAAHDRQRTGFRAGEAEPDSGKAE
jgi:hypothetical protein